MMDNLTSTATPMRAKLDHIADVIADALAFATAIGNPMIPQLQDLAAMAHELMEMME